MKYRVLEGKDGWFYPQYKSFLFWKCFNGLWDSVIHYATLDRARDCLRQAKEDDDYRIAKKARIAATKPKIHPYP